MRPYRATTRYFEVQMLVAAATFTQSVSRSVAKISSDSGMVTSALLLHSWAHRVTVRRVTNGDGARRDKKLGGGSHGSSQPRRRKVPTPPRADILRAMRQQPVHAGMVGIGR